ncbi:MAG TPA: hypothetical protein VK249_04100 [Anaerolineales bacterium]|nr:hypothetical protein [Anaerolineales bacterium]
MDEKGQIRGDFGVSVSLAAIVLVIVVFVVLKGSAVWAIVFGIIAGILSALVITGIFAFFLRSLMALSEETARRRLAAISITLVISVIAGSVFWSKFFLNRASIAQRMQATNTILLIGKVVDPVTKDWNNNRLVLVFERGKEVGRAVSHRGELPENHLGVIDGLFEIEFPNAYKFAIADFEANQAPLDFQMTSRHNNFIFSRKVIYSWIPEFPEGADATIEMKSKNVRYTIMVLPGDSSELPEALQQPGSLQLVEGNRLVLIDPRTAGLPPESFGDEKTSFAQTVEEVKEKQPETYSYNNCAGSVDIAHQITNTTIHEITDTTGGKFGVELPVKTWLKLVADIEKEYNVKNQEIKTVAVTLVVPPGENVEFSVVKRQTWVSGIAQLNANGINIAEPYQVLKNEELVYQEQKLSCP